MKSTEIHWENSRGKFPQFSAFRRPRVPCFEPARLVKAEPNEWVDGHGYSMVVF